VRSGRAREDKPILIGRVAVAQPVRLTSPSNTVTEVDPKNGEMLREEVQRVWSSCYGHRNAPKVGS
jgi:hypothetical protein